MEECGDKERLRSHRQRPRWDIELGISWAALGAILIALGLSCLLCYRCSRSTIWAPAFPSGPGAPLAQRAFDYFLIVCAGAISPCILLGVIICFLGIVKPRGHLAGLILVLTSTVALFVVFVNPFLLFCALLFWL